MSRKGKTKPPHSRREEKVMDVAAETRKVANEAPGSIGEGDAPTPRSFGPWDRLFAAALVAAVFLVYQPAWQGGLIWDDTKHVTRPELRDWHGLYRIWFDVGATLQYYPLVHSAFWVEHKLWGDATLGYHLVNIFLHAAAALMVALLLRRLKIPGAYLAAAIFALHPVQVESVAWITELKNTLSGVFYLAAALLYLRFDQTRRVGQVSNLSREQAGNLFQGQVGNLSAFQRQVGNLSYVAALTLFMAALASKTVTATLPGALLVVLWWQRGRLSWRGDVLPLLPFFLLGAGGGMITAWWELKLNHCVGPEFEFTPVERLLIAGRAVWFHLGKLFWPTDLTFIYPRWQIDSGAWRQYLFPLGAAALLAVAWAIRRRTRAPLAAALFFGGTLFPTLGFFNLYTFRYALVADHYQYLACLGIITLFSAGVTLLLQRAEGRVSASPYPQAGAHRVPVSPRLPSPFLPFSLSLLLALALLAVLAVLSWRQSQMYADVETLYRTTIARNPDCWMAYSNLAVALDDQGHVEEAIAYCRKALEIRPDHAEDHYNLANMLAGCGQVDEAIEHYRKALEIEPNYAEAHYNLGNVLAGRGRVDEAIVQYRKALEIRPDYLEAQINLGSKLAGRGQVDEAIEHYRKALEIGPDYAEVRYNIGVALARCGRVDEAIVQYRKALEIRPDYLEAHFNLGNMLAGRGQVDEAIEHYRKALDLASARNDGMLADNIRARIRVLQSTAPPGDAP